MDLQALQVRLELSHPQDTALLRHFLYEVAGFPEDDTHPVIYALSYFNISDFSTLFFAEFDYSDLSYVDHQGILRYVPIAISRRLELLILYVHHACDVANCTTLTFATLIQVTRAGFYNFMINPYKRSSNSSRVSLRRTKTQTRQRTMPTLKLHTVHDSATSTLGNVERGDDFISDPHSSFDMVRPMQESSSIVTDHVEDDFFVRAWEEEYIQYTMDHDDELIFSDEISEDNNSGRVEFPQVSNCHHSVL